MSLPQTDDPWYRDGLAFACTRCGACCTGAPGYVWVDTPQIRRLADLLGLDFDQFTRRFIRRVGDRLSLVERVGGDCVFWDRSAGCTVYSARPEQCRTWPFWPENLESESTWRDVRAGCPGVDRGQVYTLDEIQAAARRSPD